MLNKAEVKILNGAGSIKLSSTDPLCTDEIEMIGRFSLTGGKIKLEPGSVNFKEKTILLDPSVSPVFFWCEADKGMQQAFFVWEFNGESDKVSMEISEWARVLLGLGVHFPGCEMDVIDA